jgi:hypothetical protein
MGATHRTLRAHRAYSSTPTGARAGNDRSPWRPRRSQYPGLPPSTARGIPYSTGVPRSTVGIPTPAPQCAGGARRPRPVGAEGAYSEESFAIEPIQPPIVPLSLFSPQSLRTTAARKRAAPTGPPMAARRRRRAAHKSSRSVSLPSSAGSVPSRLFLQNFLPPRAVPRGTP